MAQHTGKMFVVYGARDVIISGLTIDIAFDNFHYVQGTVIARSGDTIDVSG